MNSFATYCNPNATPIQTRSFALGAPSATCVPGLIPTRQTFAFKGSLPFDYPANGNPMNAQLQTTFGDSSRPLRPPSDNQHSVPPSRRPDSLSHQPEQQ